MTHCPTPKINFGKTFGTNSHDWRTSGLHASAIGGTIEVHGFADASERAYAVHVYLQTKRKKRDYYLQ